MNILICDCITEETDKLQLFLTGEGYAAVVFSRGTDALRYVEKGGPADVCVLEIIMPEMNGIELAEKIRKTGWKGLIIFISVSKEFGPETYMVDAFDYILKPITPEKARAMFNKIEKALKNSDKKSVCLKTSGHTRMVLFSEISYVEVMQHYVTYHLADGDEVKVYATFTDTAANLLSDGRFIRCHNSFIVNMNEISDITGKNITMRDKKVLPVSRAYSGIKQRIIGGFLSNFHSLL